MSKNGDGSVRAVPYEAGHLILTRPLKGCTALKSWAMRIAKRAGTKKAAVALARKLAVIMHRMLADGTPRPSQRSAVLGTVKDEPPYGRWPEEGHPLTAACARRFRIVSGRDGGMASRSNKGMWTLKEE